MLVVIMTLRSDQFSLSTTITQYRVATIESRVNDLESNAIPSIQSLSAIRTHLRDVLEHVHQLIHDFLQGRRERLVEQTLLGEEQDLENAIHGYMVIPFFTAERKPAREMENQLGLLFLARFILFESL